MLFLAAVLLRHKSVLLIAVSYAERKQFVLTLNSNSSIYSLLLIYGDPMGANGESDKVKRWWESLNTGACTDAKQL